MKGQDKGELPRRIRALMLVADREPDMSIYDVLARDHDEVLRMFGEIRRSLEPDDRYALLGELRDELLAHARAEERVLYRRLNDDPASRELLRESYGDHEGMELLLGRLDELDPAGGEFDQRLQQLEASMRQHADYEEDRVFPSARQFLGDDAEGDLEGEFIGQKQQLLEEGLEPMEVEPG